MKSGIAGLFLASISSVGLAGEWTDKGVVQGIFIDNRTGSPRILITHKPNNGKFISVDGCRKDHNYYHLAMDREFSREAYSNILAANASKANIAFFIDGCEGEWPNIVMIDTALLYK